MGDDILAYWGSPGHCDLCHVVRLYNRPDREKKSTD